MTSILRDWVVALPLREQGTLLAAIRGCDLAPKFPVDSVERQLTAYLRWLTCNPADEREVDTYGSFMRSTAPGGGWKASSIEHYPLHWYVHVLHAYEVVAYRHPAPIHSRQGYDVYYKLTHALHLPLESAEAMIARLSEDRIAIGEVVLL